MTDPLDDEERMKKLQEQHQFAPMHLNPWFTVRDEYKDRPWDDAELINKMQEHHPEIPFFLHKALLKFLWDSILFFEEHPECSTQECLDSSTGQAMVQEFMLRALDNMKADEESYIRQ